MTQKVTWSLNGCIAAVDSWLCPENAVYFRDQSRIELPDLILNDKPKALQYAINRLNNLSLWEFNTGVKQVLEGDTTGWGHLQLGLRFSVWIIRTTFYLHKVAIEQGGFRDERLVHGALCRSLALALALKDFEIAEWCAALLLQELQHPTQFLQMWDYTAFHPFMAWLAMRWKNFELKPLPKSLKRLGPFQKIIDSWDNDQQFQTRLSDITEYQCSKTEYSDGDNPCFWSAPFFIFPAVALSIQTVRFQEKRLNVVGDHPMLNSKLGVVPDEIASIIDPLLEDYIKYFTNKEQQSGF